MQNDHGARAVLGAKGGDRAQQELCKRARGVAAHDQGTSIQLLRFPEHHSAVTHEKSQ